jgi:ATP-dependent helicase YprA (DUF1998 family)
MHNTNVFKNPITMTFNLLEDYSKLLENSLREAGLNESSISKIVEDIFKPKLSASDKILFSLNKKFPLIKETFYEFFENNKFSGEMKKIQFLADKKPYTHQRDAILSIMNGNHTIISSGTGSGKTESFIFPILDYCLKNREKGIKAILIYPMNALANNQLERINSYAKNTSVSCEIFIGNTSLEDRQLIIDSPPDILITNYVMLDYILTSQHNIQLIQKSKNSLRFLVLDEIHTFRGNKATHIKFLLRRLRYHINDNIVYVGCSATLESQKYEKDTYYEAKFEDVNNFIKPLFDIDNFEFIRPTPIEIKVPKNKTFPQINENFDFGWKLETDYKSALKNISAILGINFNIKSIKEQEPKKSRLYNAMENDAFFISLKNRLNKIGLSFLEITNLMEKFLPDNLKDKKVEIAKSYLSAISFINHIYSQNPILDFRIHLFLFEFTGYLKICYSCNKYYAGHIEICNDCGNPLFFVFKDNVNQFLGKIIKKGKNTILKPSLEEESNDPHNIIYSLIEKRNTNKKHPILDKILNFNFSFDSINKKINMNLNRKGSFQVENFDIDNQFTSQYLVHIHKKYKEYFYVYHIISAILKFHEGEQKKILGFIDNREKTGYYSDVIRDEFISQFFEEILKLCIYNHEPNNLKEAYEIFVSFTSNIRKPLKIEKEVFSELDLWFKRFISLNPRLAGINKDFIILNKDSLEEKILNIMENLVDELDKIEEEPAFFKERDRFYELEQTPLNDEENNIDPQEEKYRKTYNLIFEILNIFVTERAIELFSEYDQTEMPKYKQKKHMESKYIKYHVHNFERFIYIKNDNKHPINGIALTENSRIYRDFINKHGNEKVEYILNRLNEENILSSKDNSKFQIKSIYLNFDLDSPDETDYEILKEKFLIISAPHSSEVDKKEREKIEADFMENKINAILSTPTLEMGIDIGKLINVIMLGVPPMPSNYAQRSGRAGRGKPNNFALITTFCFDNRPHDLYYFSYPIKMIQGVISPPSFNPKNENIIKKHINAFILGGEISQYSDYKQNINSIINRKMKDTEIIFGDVFDVKDYLKNEFPYKLEKALEKSHKQRILRNYFYDTKFFPDYNFSKDEIKLIDESNGKTISQREPEIAYYKYAPFQQIYIGNDLYELEYKYLSDLNPDIILDKEHFAKPVLSFNEIKAKKILPKGRSLIKPNYDLKKLFKLSNKKINRNYRDFNLIYDSEMCLYFLNFGKLTSEGENRFRYNSKEFILGYKIKRNAFIFVFNKRIWHDKSYMSFICALDRNIKDRYGLDESEISIINDITDFNDINKEDDFENIHEYVVIYDSTGNQNIPFHKIFNSDEFIKLSRYVYDKITNCNCELKSGCYLCMKSYASSYYSADLDKDKAIIILKNILGDNISPTKTKTKKVVKLKNKIKEKLIIKILSHWHYPEKFVEITAKFPSGETIIEKGYSDIDPEKVVICELILKLLKENFKKLPKAIEFHLKNETFSQRLKNILEGKSELGSGYKKMFRNLIFNLLRFEQIEYKSEKEESQAGNKSQSDM